MPTSMCARISVMVVSQEPQQFGLTRASIKPDLAEPMFVFPAILEQSLFAGESCRADSSPPEGSHVRAVTGLRFLMPCIAHIQPPFPPPALSRDSSWQASSLPLEAKLICAHPTS